MTLAELDAAIAANPKARFIFLSYSDWKIIEQPEALPHREDHPTERGYIYRGLRVMVISPGPSRLSEGEFDQ